MSIPTEVISRFPRVLDVIDPSLLAQNNTAEPVPGPGQPVAVSPANLTQGDWPARFAALGHLPPDQPVPTELHEALLGLLAAPQWQHRELAVAAISRTGSLLVQPLIALLQASSPAGDDQRRAAMIALGRMGRTARAALPVLREMQEDSRFANCALIAIKAIRGRADRGEILPRLFAAIAISSALLVVGALCANPASVPLGLGLGLVGLCVAVLVGGIRASGAGTLLVFVAGYAVLLALSLAMACYSAFTEVARTLAPR